MSIQMEIQWRSALLSPYGAQGLKYVRMCAARVAESPIPANAPDGRLWLQEMALSIRRRDLRALGHHCPLVVLEKAIMLVHTSTLPMPEEPATPAEGRAYSPAVPPGTAPRALPWETRAHTSGDAAGRAAREGTVRAWRAHHPPARRGTRPGGAAIRRVVAPNNARDPGGLRAGRPAGCLERRAGNATCPRRERQTARRTRARQRASRPPPASERRSVGRRRPAPRGPPANLLRWAIPRFV